MPTQAYLELFQHTVDAIQHSGGAPIGDHPGLDEYRYDQKMSDPSTNNK